MDLYAIYKAKNIDDILMQTKILLLSPIVFVCEASQSCFSVMVAKNDCFFFSFNLSLPYAPRFRMPLTSCVPGFTYAIKVDLI